MTRLEEIKKNLAEYLSDKGEWLSCSERESGTSPDLRHYISSTDVEDLLAENERLKELLSDAEDTCRQPYHRTY